MPIPNKPNPQPYCYHVYDIPCAHTAAVGHGGGCGPHRAQTQFASANIASWLPPVPAAPAVAATDHTARAVAATRTAEEPAAVVGHIIIHPNSVGDRTGPERLSLLQDMDDLNANAHVDLHVQRGSLGPTYFGRQIPYIMMGGNRAAGGVANAPQVLLTGGIHAREWIAVEVPYLIAEYLIRNYAPYVPAGVRAGTRNQVRISELLDHCRVCIIPMLNPDGHCWSVANSAMDTHHRIWRRNRRRWSGADLSGPGMRVELPAAPPETVYEGVDCNRNFPRRGPGPWPETRPDRETFAGPNYASEAETRLLLDFIGQHLTYLAGSIDYHSAMGRVLYHGDIDPPGAYRTPEKVYAKQVAGCMWKHIKEYGDGKYGNGPTTIERESNNQDQSYGAVMDCCYDVMSNNNRVPLAYTIELDPIKTGRNTYTPACRPNAADRWFRIPADGIRKVFEKNFTAALCLMQFASLNLHNRVGLGVIRGPGGAVVGRVTCPFGKGTSRGRLDTVAKVKGRGNQPPNP